MIRLAKIIEIPMILAITKACAKDMIRQNIFQWNEEYPSKDAFENDIKRNELYVFISDDSLIGCMVLTPTMDTEYIPINWLTVNDNNLYIHRLAIHPKKQGKGYAQKLMAFAENFAVRNNYNSIRLDTFSKNIKNQKFYEIRGFKRLGNIYFPKQSEYPFHCYELVL